MQDKNPAAIRDGGRNSYDRNWPPMKLSMSSDCLSGQSTRRRFCFCTARGTGSGALNRPPESQSRREYSVGNSQFRHPHRQFRRRTYRNWLGCSTADRIAKRGGRRGRYSYKKGRCDASPSVTAQAPEGRSAASCGLKTTETALRVDELVRISMGLCKQFRGACNASLHEEV